MMTQSDRAEDIKRAITRIEAELSAIKEFQAHYDEADGIALIGPHAADLKTYIICLDYQCRRYTEIDLHGDKK